MFNDKTIEKRVMKVVRGRIASAQKEYDTQSKQLDVDHDEAVKALETKLEKDREQIADTLVNSILGKIL